MSGINGDRAAHYGPARAWESLSSEHERLVLTAENQAAAVGDGPAAWAGLASSSQTAPGLRLVVRAA